MKEKLDQNKQKLDEMTANIEVKVE